MSLGVRDIEHLAMQHHALWVVKTGGCEIAIGAPDVPASGDIQYLPVHIRDHDAVVIGIRDKELPGCLIRLDFAGKRKHAVKAAIFF